MLAAAKPSHSPCPAPILLTVTDLHLGGIARDVRNIAIHLDRSRFVPHIATYDARGMRFDELRAAGVPVLEIPSPSRKDPRRTFRAAASLKSYIRTHGIRLLHAFDSTAIFTTPLARAFGVSVVVSSQLTSRRIAGALGRSYMRWTDRIVDAVVVNCKALGTHMRDDERVPAKRINVCYNGVDTAEFYPRSAPKVDGIPADGLLIGTLCVLRREKSLHILQEAFARLRHLSVQLRLLIAGSGSELTRLEQNCALLGIRDQSIFLPSTPRVAPLLSAMDIFVVCSESEGLPNALLEAMACGCCVVASRVGGIPEAIGKNERGLLFCPGDPADLADKLAALISDASLRRVLAARAARFASEHFSVSKTANRMKEIYSKLLADREIAGL